KKQSSTRFRSLCRSRTAPPATLFALIISLALAQLCLAGSPPRKRQPGDDLHMSSMGRLARIVALARSHHPEGGADHSFLARSEKSQPPADDEADSPAGGQAELSIAVDVTG